MKQIKVALIGTPNVGKSTIYNTLTRNHEHTGNWAGKTVGVSKGECSYEDVLYTFYDLPGTYSLISKSKEEVVATDFVLFQSFDVAVVVCDATSLEKGIHLFLQTREICKKVIVCVNLMDEADKKGIEIDFKKLEDQLGTFVVKMSAREKVGLNELLYAIKNAKEQEFLKLDYGDLNQAILDISSNIKDTRFNSRWIALKILEENTYYIRKFQELGILKESNLDYQDHNCDVHLEVALKFAKYEKEILKDVIFYKDKNYNFKTRKIDKILTSKIWGIPIMLCMLFVVFYLTIVGANYPSSCMFSFFSYLENPIIHFLEWLSLPNFLIDLLVNGIYKTLYWVVSVMLPPMLIFFPIFTFLEDLGVLPRIAFNLDRAFSKCRACGKQALTMCMGIGCNAVGVTGARIIDSKRERLIAILTNVFMPCNGKFPSLIAIITIFFVGLDEVYGAFLCALILTGFLFLGIILTFLVSFLLSKTILKGEPSSFTLELPPYRRPQVGSVILRSVFDRTLFVLGRAAAVAAPAGLIIWILANTNIGAASLLAHLSSFLDPFARVFGLDGVILMAFLLGFPANEIVIPIAVMAYMAQGHLENFENLAALRDLLTANGWTWVTALCTMTFSLMHWPCSTTLLTIRKETGSWKWTAAACLVPTICGLTFCFLIASCARLFGVL